MSVEPATKELIGIIGLGEIARKAYLPVISRRRVEIHLCTRNEEALRQLGDEYRITNLHHSLASLINSGVRAAFVHAATIAHEDIVEQLLSHHIHVFVDKPVTYHYSSTEKLVRLANEHNLVLRVGFNRRFAPAYTQLRALRDPSMIIMQKNRRWWPGDVRTFIFDDFIHLIDTLLYLFPHPIASLTVTGKKLNGLLHHVVIQLIADDGATAIGILNRDSGAVDERLEVITARETRVVTNVTDTFIHQDKTETKLGTPDWSSTLHTRGIEAIVDEFLHALRLKPPPDHSADLLRTHRVCEDVVAQLSVGT